MAPVATNTLSLWRSPPPDTAAAREAVDRPASPLKADLLHPSFLPPCEHAKDGGEMHAHAFDLLSLAGQAAAKRKSTSPPAAKQSPAGGVASSVPAISYLSANPPANPAALNGSTPAPPKARRMSSSTTGVLGRGKLGLTGDPLLGKDVRPTLTTNTSSPIPSRRLSNAAANGSPQLFDFAKTDRRPSAARAVPRGVASSLPARGGIVGVAGSVKPPPAVQQPQADDMELDMEFGDDDDDDNNSGGRSGSAELDMDMDDDETKPEWEKLALGTGSGGIKGRRKGMVFKCESCSKEYRHPSCLVKHRWEHSPHWREPTQISMSKHQQVQMLEAAAILSHMDPNQGRSLPQDKSLWPAMLSPQANGRRELPNVRSPPPLTPSSLREVTSFMERKTSPDSDTTSSMGAVSETFTAGTSPHPATNTLGLGLENGHSRPVGIADAGRRKSSVSSIPATPGSLGSLPDMTGLHFHTGSTPNTGASPLPNRGLPLSLGARASMIGGGMFGGSRTPSFKVPDSSVRGGLNEDDEDGEDELQYTNSRVPRKSSSEEAEDRRRDDEGFELGTMDL